MSGKRYIYVGGLLAALLLHPGLSFAQGGVTASLPDPVGASPYSLHIPDIPGYRTLKCDFHLHTVFSDGLVWPTVRVDEAVRDDLDAIAVTDHLQLGRHFTKYVSGDFNSSYEIALAQAVKKGITLIRGAEITFSNAEGHYNALFIKDANPIAVDDLFGSVAAASAQGAFITWNHPCNRLKRAAVDPAIQGRLIAEGKIQGVEVVNSDQLYLLGLELCARDSLVFMSGSDSHAPVKGYGKPGMAYRPLTLVFATRNSGDAIREAMFAGRTAVLYGNYFYGRNEYLRALMEACLSFGREEGEGRFSVTNLSGIDFVLDIGQLDGLRALAGQRTPFSLHDAGGGFRVRVRNMFTGVDTNPVYDIDIE